jgi:PAS domain S-box-containing protein
VDELRGSDALYRALAENSPDALLLVDAASGRYILANPAAERLLGYRRDELLRLGPADLTPPQDRPALEAATVELLERGSWRGEWRLRRKDGALIEVDLSVQTVEVGGALLLQGMLRDLTERKRVEGRFKDLVDGVEAIVWEADAQTWEFTFVSRRAEEILGYPAEQWLAEPTFWQDHIHPEDREVAVGVCGQACAEGRNHQFEYRAIAADGRVVWIRDIVYIVHDAEGRARYLRGLMVDITEQVRQRARRETLLRVARRIAAEGGSEQVLDVLFEEAPLLVGGDGVIVNRWDEEQQRLVPVRNTFPNAAEFPRLPAGAGAVGEAIERRAPVIVNDYQAAENVVAPAWRAGLRAGIAVPLLHKGRLLGALAVGSFDPARRFDQADAAALELLAGIAAAVLDGLERSRLEGALLAARTAQHRLSNELSLLVGYGDLLSRDPRLPDDLREMLREAQGGVEAAADILHQLQRLSRLEQLDLGGPGPVIDLSRSVPEESGDGSRPLPG